MDSDATIGTSETEDSLIRDKLTPRVYRPTFALKSAIHVILLLYTLEDNLF